MSFSFLRHKAIQVLGDHLAQWLITLSILASLFFVVSGIYTYLSIEKTLDTALRLQAQGLEVALRGLVKSFDLETLRKQSEFFTELLLSQGWEGVAYVVLYEKNGKILLHSNPDLIGKIIDAASSQTTFPRSYFQTLASGEEVYVFENSIDLAKGQAVLRIALHVVPAEEALSYAKRHVYLNFLLGLALLLLGGVLSFLSTKAEKLKKKLDELKHWQFVAQVLAHEMKNPLASIKGFAQLVLKKEGDERNKIALSLIVKETLHIERLLKNLTTYTHLPQVKPSTFDLLELLTETMETFKLLYEDIELKITVFGREFGVQTDRDLLKEVLLNLLENSLQASKEAESSRIELSLSSENRFHVLQIRDYGLGIPKELEGRIWEPFFTTKAKGMGLGLAIVQKICRELDVELKLRSEVGGGTEVWLRIPKELNKTP